MNISGQIIGIQYHSILNKIRRAVQLLTNFLGFNMNILGQITGIQYSSKLSEDLLSIDLQKFDINKAPSACIVNNNGYSFAISKWVSPKRTRSYPYERVYNTLNSSKKITVIPIVKDEGARGDRDFLQWDTISLMSLFDIFVIFAYYHKAERSGDKITNQQYDNNYILTKLNEIQQYHSSALHWNLKELGDLNFVVNKAIDSYKKIECETGVKLHSMSGLIRFQNKIGNSITDFMSFSREKSENAQSREFVTIQPKERLSSATKAKITITNYLGGKYFFTVDEIKISENVVYLIEGKHSKNTMLPSKGDIKDGLLKMILYSNLKNVKVDNTPIDCIPTLLLTSTILSGKIDTNSSTKDVELFYNQNRFTHIQQEFVNLLLQESKENKFLLRIEHIQ